MGSIIAIAILVMSVISSMVTGKTTVGSAGLFALDVADRRVEPIMFGLGVLVRLALLAVCFVIAREIQS